MHNASRKTVTVRVFPEDRDWLQKLADKHRVSSSVIVSMAKETISKLHHAFYELPKKKKVR